MTATTNETVALRPGTRLYPLNEHGLADRSIPERYMIDVDGSEDVPVVGRYAGHLIVRFHDGEEYAVTNLSVGYAARTLLDIARATMKPYDVLLEEAEEAAQAFLESGPHTPYPDDGLTFLDDFRSEPR